MRLRSLRAWAGLRFERFSSSSATLRLLHADEVLDLAEHPCDLRRLVALGGLADPAEAKRAQRAAVALGLADRAPHLRDPQPCHQEVSAASSADAPAAGGAAGAAGASASTTAGDSASGVGAA